MRDFQRPYMTLSNINQYCDYFKDYMLHIYDEEKMLILPHKNLLIHMSIIDMPKVIIFEF